MSYHEAQKIRKKLAPFISLLLAVACMGLLASCGGGGSNTSTTPDIEIRYGVEVPIDGASTRAIQSENIVAGEISGAKYVAKEIIVAIDSINDEAQFLPLVKTKGWTIVSYAKDLDMYTLSTNANTEKELKSTIAELKQLPYVRVAKFNTVVYGPKGVTSDPSWSIDAQSWNMRAIKLPEARDLILYPGQGVRVGVVDSRFVGDSQDLVFENIDYVQDKYVPPRLAGGYVRGSKDAVANPNHGMHVAGIVGATNNSIGMVGIVPNASISAVDPFGASGYSAIEAIYRAMSIAAGKGVKVINLSIGANLCDGVTCTTKASLYPTGEEDDVKDNIYLFDKFLTQYPKLIFVQSSGNDGQNYFGTSVGQTGAQDKKIYAEDNGILSLILGSPVSSFSSNQLQSREKIARRTIIVGSYAPDSGANKVTPYTMVPGANTASKLKDGFILAPGGSETNPVYSTILPGTFEDYRYGFMYGTSMAAPHVTGVAALVWQANSSLSASEVRDIILTNSDTVDGYRALNAEKAVRAALDTLTKPTVTLAATTTTPQLSQSVEFTATASSPNGAIKTYSWSFGDGTTLTGQTSPTTTHAYSATGDYAVTVTVTDEKGASSTSTAVHILPVSPVPTPTVTGITAPGSLTAGVNATFSINGSNLPTGENLLITPSGVGCTGFGYGTRSATAHTFACTPSAAGTLTFTIATAGGVSLGSRDVTVSASSTEKYSLVSNGAGGFYDKTECVKDTVTGLIWEGKTASGLRSTYSYTNYNSSVAGNMQRWNGQGTAIYDATANDVAASTNSIGYVNYVNQLNLCGLGAGWRVPTKDELMGLVDASVANGQKINQNWFPNTGQYYWSSSPNTENATYTVYGWAVDFNSGSANAYYARYNNLYIRLVRAGQ